MFNRNFAPIRYLTFALLVLVAGCKPVYHLARIEKESQSVQPGNIDQEMDATIAPYRAQLTDAMETGEGYE